MVVTPTTGEVAGLWVIRLLWVHGSPLPMMAAKPSANPLRDLPFFAGLPDTLLWHLGKLVERRTLEANELLFKEGEARQFFGILVKGTIAIEQHRDGSTVQITTLGTGEAIGEGVLLDDDNHGTQGRATEPTELIYFKKGPLMKLLKDQPAIYASLLSRAAKIISARIKKANLALLESRRGR
jgi:CRP-like cAMP-binding protein